MNLDHRVKTWCENTQEGERYLSRNGYGRVKRMGSSQTFKTEKIGKDLKDVFVIK